jgi:hypothetical protein
LQGLLLRVELGDPFGNASASHNPILRGNVARRLPIASPVIPAKPLSQIFEFITPEF